MGDFSDIVMSLSIVPYMVFLYLVYRIRKINPALLHKTTMIGFAAMLGFVSVTIIMAIIALKVMNAKTLGHVDYLHGIAEGALTVTNGLIAIGLKKQLDALKQAEPEDAESEEATPVLTASSPNAYPSQD